MLDIRDLFTEEVNMCVLLDANDAMLADKSNHLYQILDCIKQQE